MIGFVDKLELLCIKEISDNIHRYCRLSDKILSIRYPSFIGEKILTKYIIKSYEARENRLTDILDEKGLKFIFDYCSISEFYIFPKTFKNIKYFDFLNGKHLKSLTLSLENSIEIKNYDFLLTVDKLHISNIDCKMDISKSENFLLNCKIEETLMLNIYHNDCNMHQEFKHEKIIFSIMKNTSKNLKNIKISFIHPPENFARKLLKMISGKENLNKIQLNFSKCIPTYVLKDIYSSSVNSITNFKMNWLDTCSWDFKDGNEIFKSLKNLKYLKFVFDYLELNFNVNEIIEFLNILKIFNSKTLNKIFLYFHDISKFQLSLKEFLNNCNFLDQLTIEESNFPKRKSTVNFFDSLIPTSKNLKIIEWRNFHMETDDSIFGMNNLFLNCQLTELKMYGIKFNNSNCKQLFIGLENSKNQLISLIFDSCYFRIDETEQLIESLKKFKKLQIFSLSENQNINEETVNEICKSLLNCSGNLEKFRIFQDNVWISNLNWLIELFKNCIQLQKVEMNVIFENQNLQEYFDALKSSQHNLEEIVWNIRLKDNDYPSFVKFLTDFRNLKRIANIHSYLSIENKEKLIRKLRVLKFTEERTEQENFTEFHIKKLSKLQEIIKNFE